MGLVLLLIWAAMYFAPTIVAFNRNRHNKGAICALNVFLGWTVVGWVVALVWALSSSQPPVVVVQQPPHQ
jgi:hypothetical protein